MIATASRAPAARVSAGLIEYCSASGCVAPTTYASQQATPSEIVLGAESLFWVSYGTYFSGPRKSTGYTGGGVAACPLGGCDGGPTVLAQQQSYPASLALSATTAYWVQGGVILSCAVTGCDRAPATFLSPPGDVAVGGLASDENNLYFAIDDTAYRKILRCPLDGCAGGPQPLFFEPHISGIDSMQIAVDAARVYFLTNNGERVASVPK